jgi:hypothetical protein
MKIRDWKWVIIGLATVAGATAQTSSGAERGEVVVRMLNRAGAESRDIQAAAGKSQRILEQAGVKTVWLDCTPDELGFMPEGACQPAPGPMHLTLRIVKRPHKTAPVTKASFGLATYPESGFAAHANVFSERAAAIARAFAAEESLMLGIAMAHEVGHLLLGEGSHSRNGIMTARWGDREVTLAQRGAMEFSPKQAKKMQASVQARVESLSDVAAASLFTPN